MPTPSPVQPEVESRSEPYETEVLAGESEAVTRLRLQISRIAPHFRTALITGEAGVGKETVAREMHRLSRRNGPAGSFSAVEISRFAEDWQPCDAEGVLFLQGLEKLDPALQERLVERLQAIQRQTRVIVSSEFELRALLAAGRIRQSLAARVGGLEIRVSALRDRLDDLPTLAGAMLDRMDTVARFGSDVPGLLQQHHWPGNLRELWTLVQQLSAIDGVIQPHHLPDFAPPEPLDDSGTRLDKVMQKHVFDVLQRCSGNKLRAAEMLGISRSTLYRMLEAAGD